MKIYLTSTDRNVQSICEDTIATILHTGWTLQIVTAGNSGTDGDVYIWDVEPQQRLSGRIEGNDGWRHIFLVNRDEVQHFREQMRFPDVNIVLKPIAGSALAAYLSEACGRIAAGTQNGEEVSVRSLQADRDDILQCLMQTNLKLQEYDQDRTNFLARAIHDFRAPLTAITGYCGLLLGDDLGPLTEDQREVLERMQRSAKKLSRMANSMFQLSIAPRLELSANLEKGEIRDCIDRALHEIVPVAEEKQVSISVDIAPSPGALYFENLKMEQVIVNLLDNACKFTPRGGAIAVHGYPYFWDQNLPELSRVAEAAKGGIPARHAPNSYRVDIRDNGPGIPAAHLGKIFEEYTAYGGGVDRSGGGLGLAICRMILSQHHGRIWADSSSLGAVFSFVLPFDMNGADLASPAGGRVARAAVSV